MIRKFRAAFPLCALTAFALPPILAHANSQWGLDSSALTYTVTHPMHTVEGTTHAARGSGDCSAGRCEFLIAVPVNTFSTGDSNRDLHMVEAVRGAQFPMVLVHASFAEAELNQQWIHPDLEVEFAGQTTHYNNVPFKRVQQGKEVHITGTIPLTCSEFKIQRPSFLTVPIKDEIPVQVDMSWHQQ